MPRNMASMRPGSRSMGNACARASSGFPLAVSAGLRPRAGRASARSPGPRAPCRPRGRRRLRASAGACRSPASPASTTAPASASSSSRRRWICVSGVSRGTTTRGRLSLSATSPTRWMSVRVVPRAMCAAVAIEHGQMTAASGKLLPLAGGAARSSGAYTLAVAPAMSRNAAVTSSRPCAGSSSSWRSTSSAAVRDAQLQLAAGVGQRLQEPHGVGRSAGAADADEDAPGWCVGHRAPGRGAGRSAQLTMGPDGTGHRSSRSARHRCCRGTSRTRRRVLYTSFGWSATEAGAVRQADAVAGDAERAAVALGAEAGRGQGRRRDASPASPPGAASAGRGT